ncbi:MAG: DUF805 domain-containing protein [Paenirhodobacter sp.]|uniref:DUF805 domain-containing protein n=1 Tax=Paenirhodobacter sp. TaxID=1965326 RepID=UPI003D0FB4E4
MNFPTAIRSCLQKYVTFSGRASRPEYWWFVLFLILAQLVLNILDTAIFGTGEVTRGPGSISWVSHGGPLSAIFLLATLLPGLAVAVRRMHDLGKSGWWLLIAFVPFVGGLVLLYFLVQPSQPMTNQFGPMPAGTVPPLPTA